MKKTLQILFKSLLAGVLLIVLYAIVSLVLSSLSSNSAYQQCQKGGVEIYILSNGVHTDLVLPMTNEWKDWSSALSPETTKDNDSNARLVAFGWGDKGFYLETPTWADLKFSTAFKAMFFMSSTAMHVTFYNSLKTSKSCRKICVRQEEYLELVDYIENSFDTKQQKPQMIIGHAYGNHDLFFEAKGTYSLLKTCNTWANSGLKAARLKACVWTPFDWAILNKYPY